MTVVTAPITFRPPRRFDNAAEWLRSLGGVPLERVIFDPWPGTATDADLLRFVERDKRMCELVDGTLVEKPVGYLESWLAMRLGARLTIWAESTDAGYVSGADSTHRMSTGRVRLPDVAFVSRGRLPAAEGRREAVLGVAPDLAVEVLSESNTPAEIDQKLKEYFQSGTQLVWVIEPRAQTIAVYHAAGSPTRVLGAGDTLDGEAVASGFALPVADLFRNPPPGVS